MDDAWIREVEPAEAEAVLSLRVFIPGVAEGGEERHSLSRRPPRYHSEVESVTVNSHGSVTERGTMTITEDVVVAQHCYADGLTPDGRECGFGKTVSISGRPAGGIAVHVSMYWNCPDGGRGSFGEELVVPWLGRARRELGDGVLMAAEITGFRCLHEIFVTMPGAMLTALREHVVRRPVVAEPDELGTKTHAHAKP